MTANDAAVERRRAWIAAVEGRDADVYASIVTEDVVWFPPVGDPLQGRATFRRWIEPFMGAFRYNLRLAPTRSKEAGAWAYETGAFRSIMEPLDGGAVSKHDGYYFVLWRNERDGAWRIERYVDLAEANSGTPGLPAFEGARRGLIQSRLSVTGLRVQYASGPPAWSPPARPSWDGCRRRRLLGSLWRT